MKKLKTTSKIEQLNREVTELRENLPAILSQGLLKHKISIEEKITYLKAISNHKNALFKACAEAYPEIDNKSYTVSNYFIEYDENKV